MLAVSGAFPLTSDQPPLAVVTPKALAALMPGWDRAGALRQSGVSSAARSDYLAPGSPGDPSDGLTLLGLRNPFAVAGPPPAFEANVLEIERRFEAVLARIELARAQREMRRGSEASVTAPGHDFPPGKTDAAPLGFRLADPNLKTPKHLTKPTEHLPLAKSGPGASDAKLANIIWPEAFRVSSPRLDSLVPKEDLAETMTERQSDPLPAQSTILS